MLIQVLKNSETYVHAPHTQNPHKPSLSRFKSLRAQIFRGKSEPLYSTQYSGFIVTYINGFTGQPNPQPTINQYISWKLVFDNSNNQYVFPTLNVSNKFPTIDNDAYLNTKFDYTVNHVFRYMTVQERNTLHSPRELEINQLLTILYKIRNLLEFFYQDIVVIFNVEGSTPWFCDCPNFLSPLYKTDL